ncbi:ABC transporter permease [Sphingomonas sp.]|uniref:ABC transporter permease n=1 Tax=Sphingomonas sp. TaxID=28214 RepID=UPI0038A04CDC
MMRFLRSAFVIARRDFTATVLSKTFIFFLLGPLFPLLFGGVFAGIGNNIANQAERPVVAVVAPRAEFDRLAAARGQLADALGDQALVQLVNYPPGPDLRAQEKKLLATRLPPVRAVLSGSLDHPHLTGALAQDPGTLGQLKLMLATARSRGAGPVPDVSVTNVSASTGTDVRDRALTAQVAQVALFLLTLMLSTMVLSQLIEEKSNKIIEVIAAAIPIDAMFVGKLFAMLSASVLGLVVWIGAGALLVQLVKHGGVATLPVPAVGWPVFLALGIIYFAMNYLLFGAAFLMIGAQASTAREVQTMSMPVTFAQVLIFGFASTAIGAPDSVKGLAASIFPLSSPMAMLARAAQEPAIWPHVAAIAWQAVWVALILRVGAQLFRKTVLKSGPRVPWWKFGRA